MKEIIDIYGSTVMTNDTKPKHFLFVPCSESPNTAGNTANGMTLYATIAIHDGYDFCMDQEDGERYLSVFSKDNIRVIERLTANHVVATSDSLRRYIQVRKR